MTIAVLNQLITRPSLAMTMLSLPPSAPTRRTKAPAVAAALGLLGCVPLLVIGCEPETPAPPTPATSPRPEAEVKFEHIFEDVNRLVGTAGAGRARDPGPTGGANTESTQTVEHQLHPPVNEGDSYRGTITITRRYTVTMFTFNRDNESSSSNDQQRTDEPVDDAAGMEGGDPMQSGEASTGGLSSPLTSGSPMKTREGESVRDFELEYIDGSWRLLTDPDPDTEMSIKSAFDYALRRQ